MRWKGTKEMQVKKKWAKTKLLGRKKRNKNQWKFPGSGWAEDRRTKQSESLRPVYRKSVTTGLSPGVCHWPAGEVGRLRPHLTPAPAGNQESTPPTPSSRILIIKPKYRLVPHSERRSPSACAGPSQTGTKCCQQTEKVFFFLSQEFEKCLQTFSFCCWTQKEDCGRKNCVSTPLDSK